MLETPSILRYSFSLESSENASGADNQQESLAVGENPQRLYAGQGREAQKRESELHGDMQSQAEMTWPPTSQSGEAGVTTLSVPIHHGRWKLERSRP